MNPLEVHIFRLEPPGSIIFSFKFKYGKTPPGYLLKALLVPIWPAGPLCIFQMQYAKGLQRGAPWNVDLAVQCMKNCMG